MRLGRCKGGIAEATNIGFIVWTEAVDGFKHFRGMDQVRQAEYLWMCLDYADGRIRR